MGIDLTDEYVELARSLSARTPVAARLDFETASAVALPFADHTFDAVWTEHVQMNVRDKRAFYREIARVLRPGGLFAFHDIFTRPGAADSLPYPMPWSSTRETSFLAEAGETRELLESLGLIPEVWVDCSPASVAWFQGVRERMRGAEAPNLGVHLLMGESAQQKIENSCRALEKGDLSTIQAVCRSPI
jgi:SAM-dependent methyltransferase